MTTEDICDHLKLEIRNKPDLVMKHNGKNDLINNSKSLANYKHMVDSVRSKLPNRKLAITNVITRKDKNEIKKKSGDNDKLSKFCKMNKIDVIHIRFFISNSIYGVNVRVA